MQGYINKSMRVSEFEGLLKFLVGDNYFKTKNKGKIKHAHKDGWGSTTKEMDNFIVLKDGIIYFAFVKDPGKVYYAVEMNG